MATLFSMSELKRAAVAIRADEAVAIAQKLIHEPQLQSFSGLCGPPSLERVCIGDDGSVVCRGCEATPGVAEIAILLEALLPERAPDVPGALRYTIARALHDVDAPPFDSIDALSAALARHEHGDRDAAVLRLAARAAAARPHPAGGDERRHGRARPSDYRRLLREADEKLYRQQLALDALSPAAAPAPPRVHRSSLARRVAAGVVAVVVGLLILASMEAMRTEPSAAASPALPARVSTTPVPAADRPVEPTTPAVQNAQRPRSRPHVQPKSPPRSANKTSSGLFPKFRVVDDFHK